jgi:hypothetical protein
MPDLKFPRFSAHGLRSQGDNTSSAHPLRGVVQEKRGLTSALKSSPQPARVATPSGADGMNNSVARAENLLSDEGPLQQLTLHVKPRVKRKVLQLAETTGKSPSSTGSRLLEKAVQQHVDMEYGELLKPAFEAMVDKRLTKGDNRLAYLLVLILLSVEQTRFIQANSFSRMPGVTDTILNAILDKASTEAPRIIAKRKPQREDIKTMMHELKEMLAAPDEEEETKPPPK